jgi:hypothetical protein
MNIGDFRTRRKVTAKFYFADESTPTQYRDYGNVLMLKQEPKIDRAQQLTAQKGYVQITHEEPSKVDLRWTIKGDEHATDLIGLIHLADAPSTVTQSSGTGTAWSLSSVQPGYSYYVGAMSLKNFVVTGKALNVDYTVDTGSGMLYVVPSGSIAANSNIAGTFDKAALTFSQYTSLTKTFRRGYVRLQTFDQNTTTPREVVTFHGELYVSDWGDNDGQKYNETTLMLLAIDQPVIQALELA